MNRKAALLTLFLVLFAVFATAFALINYNNSVKVWPLMTSEPLTLVIGVSLVLGAILGALLFSLLQHRGGRPGLTNASEASGPDLTPSREHAVRKS